MMLPTYSLRRLMLLVTLSGVVCLVPAMAARGYLWAIAATVALVAALVLLVIQGSLFLAILTLARLFARRGTRAIDGPGR